MKKVVLMLMLTSSVWLSGCKPPEKSEQASDIAVEISSTRNNYLQTCVQSALKNQQNVSAEKRAFATNTCNCVYDEGILAYGGEKAWEEAISGFDKSTQTNAKLADVSNKAIATCLERFLPKKSASAVSASAPASASTTKASK